MSPASLRRGGHCTGGTFTAAAALSSLSPPQRRRRSRLLEARAAGEDGGNGAEFSSHFFRWVWPQRETHGAVLRWAAMAPARPDLGLVWLDPVPLVVDLLPHPCLVEAAGSEATRGGGGGCE